MSIMQAEEPLVSILMTAYNRQEYIGEAIESVLASAYTNWELIIVDDKSTDNTLAIAESFLQRDERIRVYVNGENLGDYPNRNKAASYARGKYIKYLDADDILYDFGLQIAVKMTESMADAGFGLSTAPDNDVPCPVLVQPREIYLEHFFMYSHFDRAPGSGLIKREVFNKIGGFSGKRMIGDYEFWFKIARYYPMVKLPIDLYWNRLHPGQESKTEFARNNYNRLRKEVLKEALVHPDCPLTAVDLIRVKKWVKKSAVKTYLITRLSKLKRMVLPWK